MKRRNFLKYTSAGVVIPSLAGGIGAKALGFTPLTSALAATPMNDKVVVMIYLAGGNDGLNTVVPLDQLSKLNNARPHVIMPDSSLLKLDGTNVALHPAMAGFKDLFDEDRLQIIQSVGYPNQDFSHFRSADIWMSGSDADVVISNGVPGRYLNYEYPNYPADYPNDEMTDPLAIELGWSGSMIFQGQTNSMGMVINSADDFYNLIQEEVEPAPDTNAGERIEYIRLIAQQSQVYGKVVKEAAAKVTSQGSYPESDLAQQLKVVARLIAGGLKTKMYMVTLDGFDTHDYQVENSDKTQGPHAELLRELSEGVSAFMKDCDGLGVSDRVMGMTFSEFGRRIISNASGGTDHGAAAPQFLFGNHVASGVLGENPDIPNNPMYDDNLEMQYDFRQVYASIFEQWLCLESGDRSGILLNDFDTLPITSTAICSPSGTHEINQKAGKSLIEVSPNPVSGVAKIKFVSTGSPLIVRLYDVRGSQVGELLRGSYPSGKHSFIWDSSVIPAGNYFVRITGANFDQSKKLVKI
ncbi:DUF1501 domain-containing protein [Portibacter lacus]|uniref:DUF1501 domain-containing protein n=1 Tax=Portibacter lacus TaxID=1099794 RepID=A0AA37SNY4_9BACT|nr:DUF1501 domain-containing protein [Portibacter lacus]GLR17200.1 hypothetical protein GCM10007940_18150 [Portibacter lacus]